MFYLMAGSRRTCTGGYITPKILVGLEHNTYNKNNVKLEKENYDMEKLRVFEAFCGYGSQSIALENIGVPHDVVAISDIDADVLISYGAIRGALDKSVTLTDDKIKEWLMARNIGWDFQKEKSSIPRMKKDKLHKLYNSCVDNNCLGDVSIINPNDIPDHDLFTYSFPCQSISIAGKMEGLEKGGGTRSGLLWECEKIIAAKKPKYLLMENVKNLVGKKFKHEFDSWCGWLEIQGYKNFYQVLNAKDYGIPQNRERVFMISILDESATYDFPNKFPLELRLKDILEHTVDDKYYIDNEKVESLINNLVDKNSVMLGMCQAKREGKPREYSEASPTLSARDYKEPRLINESSDKLLDICKSVKIGGLFDDKKVQHQAGSIWDTNGLSPTVDTCQGGYRQPCVVVKEATKKGYAMATVGDSINIEQPNSMTRRGIIGCGVANTLTTSCNQATLQNTYRIRKLTPKECWRLMGMKDEYIDRCVDAGLSNSQLYKQAGNSIVVDVLKYIFKELFKEYIVSEVTSNFTQTQEN